VQSSAHDLIWHAPKLALTEPDAISAGRNPSPGTLDARKRVPREPPRRFPAKF